MKRDELAVMKAVAICYKPFLKPEEALIYCNLGHSQLVKRKGKMGCYKTERGYWRREDLDRMMGGGVVQVGKLAVKEKFMDTNASNINKRILAKTP